eukprot:UN15842
MVKTYGPHFGPLKKKTPQNGHFCYDGIIMLHL